MGIGMSMSKLMGTLMWFLGIWLPILDNLLPIHFFFFFFFFILFFGGAATNTLKSMNA